MFRVDAQDLTIVRHGDVLRELAMKWFDDDDECEVNWDSGVVGRKTCEMTRCMI